MDKKVRLTRTIYFQLTSIGFFILSMVRPVFFYKATSIGCRGSDIRLPTVSSYYVDLQCVLHPFEFSIFILILLFLILDTMQIGCSYSFLKKRKKFRQIIILFSFILFIDLSQLLVFGDEYGNYQISEGYVYYIIAMGSQLAKYRVHNTI